MSDHGTDPRAELLELVRSSRALAEQLLDSGADVLARGTIAWPASSESEPRAHASSEARPDAVARAAPTLSAPPRAEPAPAPIRREPAQKPAAPPAAPSFTVPASLDPAVRFDRLAELAARVAGCVACPLHGGRTQTVFARGEPGAQLMFVGEGPGFEEDQQGLPFVGPAGQLLDKMIVAMGYQPDQVYIANVVKCRPPGNRKPEASEVGQCVGFLHTQIELVNPKVIVALGATACEGLLGVGGITRIRGSWRLYRGRIPVMPTFHPAYLLRTPDAKREVWSDLKQVMARLRES